MMARHAHTQPMQMKSSSPGTPRMEQVHFLHHLS